MTSISSYISAHQKEYSKLLKQLHSPPKTLYYKGDVRLLNSRSIAIVGPRKASIYGKKVVQHFVPGLVKAGYTIVSGMAAGIDTEAHRATLECKGKTIAVLGTEVNTIFPARNRSLYNQIASQGLILSAYAPGTPYSKWNFPKRNRIISGLSCATLVIEATERSGSLITARCALEQNREVFAVPGDIFQGNTKGIHRLISEGKAKLVTSPEDIREELEGAIQSQIPFDTKVLTPLTTKEKLVHDAVGEYSVASIEDITAHTGLPYHQICKVLPALQLKGLLKQISGNLYCTK